MYLDVKNRIARVAENALHDPVIAHGEALTLYSIMLHPEISEDEICSYNLEMQERIIAACFGNQKDREQYYRENPEIAAVHAAHMLSGINNRGHSLLEKTYRSRKKGNTGARDVRGQMAGHLLKYLVDPTIPQVTDLNAACKWYRDNIDQADDIALPSESLLKGRIWDEFKHVAHLWAALVVYKHEYDKVLLHGFSNPESPITPHQAPTILRTFFCIASYFRGQLIELVNPINQVPLFADPSKAWNILTEDKQTFPPARPSRKKNL